MLSIIIGTIVGTGIAYAHNPIVSLVSGTELYESGTFHSENASGIEYDFKEDHAGDSDDGENHLEIFDTGYWDGWAETDDLDFCDIDFFKQRPPDHFVRKQPWFGVSINGADGWELSSYEVDDLETDNDAVITRTWAYKPDCFSTSYEFNDHGIIISNE